MYHDAARGSVIPEISLSDPDSNTLGYWFCLAVCIVVKYTDREFTTLPILKCRIQWHRAHGVVQLLPRSSSKIFHRSTWKLRLHEAVALIPPPLSPWQLLMSCLSLWICRFQMFPVSGILQYVTLCGWLLSLHSIIFSRCSRVL